MQEDPNIASYTYCRYDTWDARNRHASANGFLLPSTDIVLLFTNAYDQLGRPASRAYPNGTSTAYAYAGQSGDVSSIAHTLAGGVQDLYGTTYNRVHQAAQQTTSGPAAHPPSAGVQGFGTASNDNRMSTLGYDANRLNANDNLATYGYDAEGSGQLRTAATTATGTATYRYEPFGRRYSKTVGGITTVYLQDEAGQDWAGYVLTPSGTVIQLLPRKRCR